MKKIVSISTIVLSVCVLLTVACKKKETSNLPKDGSLPADFSTFYEKFHADTAYQMSHISFPLKGVPMHADSATIVEDDFYYEKPLWIMHKPMVLNDTFYTQQFFKLTDDMILERIIQKDVNFGMERRFVKLNNEWTLIHYTAMNPLAKK
jgi:hypothetical protein